MSVDRLVSALVARLRSDANGDPRVVLDRCRGILVADPTQTVALYAAGQALAADGGARFAARLSRLMTDQSLSGAAALYSAVADHDRARRCLRRVAVRSPALLQAWHMLSLLPDDAAGPLYRSCLLSPPAAADGFRLLLAIGRILRDDTEAHGRPDTPLPHLTAQLARCLHPGVCDMPARVNAARAILVALGPRLVFEPELQAAVAGPGNGPVAARFFDLARVTVLLAPGERSILNALCSLAWGPNDLEPHREMLAVDAFSRFIMAGGTMRGDAPMSRYELFRTLIARDQRQNHEPARTARYYALLSGSFARAAGAPPRRRRRSSGRRIGLYVGSVASITARCFVPGLVTGLAGSGFDCTLYTTTAEAEAGQSALYRTGAALGVPMRSLDRDRVDRSIAIVRDDHNAMYVDLRGHSKDSLPEVLAARPAERTAHMIGTGETSGLPEVDVLVADPVLRPDAREPRTERRLLHLEGGLLHFTPADLPVEPLSETGGPGTRFGAFHQDSKINRLSVSLWAAALRHTPDSTLALKFNTEEAPGAERILVAMFVREGIAAERITFLKRTATLDGHFAQMREIDVMLDATPFNGETTTLEALWLGVPVVSVAGRRMIARFGASILHHAGLEHLCATSHQTFGETAARIAADTGWLREFRRNGRDHLMRTPTFDLDLYGRSVAAAFERALAE